MRKKYWWYERYVHSAVDEIRREMPDPVARFPALLAAHYVLSHLSVYFLSFYSYVLLFSLSFHAPVSQFVWSFLMLSCFCCVLSHPVRSIAFAELDQFWIIIVVFLSQPVTGGHIVCIYSGWRIGTGVRTLWATGGNWLYYVYTLVVSHNRRCVCFRCRCRWLEITVSATMGLGHFFLFWHSRAPPSLIPLPPNDYVTDTCIYPLAAPAVKRARHW